MEILSRTASHRDSCRPLTRNLCTRIHKTYNLIQELAHRSPRLLDLYRLHQGPPFSRPSFQPPSPTLPGLPEVTHGGEEEEEEESWLRSSHRAYLALSRYLGLVLEAQRGLNPGQASLLDELTFFANNTRGLAANLGLLLSDLGRPTPDPTEAAADPPLGAGGASDWEKKQLGLEVCARCARWLRGSEKDFAALLRRFLTRRPQRYCYIGCRLWRVRSLSRPLFTPPRPLGPKPRPPMELASVVSSLDRLAPPSLAASWDNAGLLVEPSPPCVVRTLLLTNDLTEGVMEEALGLQAQLVLSYHPPLFRPLRRVTMATWKERLIVRALENRVAIYSPHTAFDASPRGVNDWLARGLGDCSTVPLTTSTGDSFPTPGSHRLEVTVPAAFDSASLLARLQAVDGICIVTATVSSGSRLSLNCTQKALVEAVRILSGFEELYRTLEIVELRKAPLPDTGMGRFCTLRETVSINVLIQRVKDYLKLSHLRVALGVGKTLDSMVTTAAVCAGSGGSILQGVQADLYLTGEMSHHEVLDAVAGGATVVLCEHSNSERGFLTELRDVLTRRFHNLITVLLSTTDRDPLCVI